MKDRFIAVEIKDDKGTPGVGVPATRFGKPYLDGLIDRLLMPLPSMPASDVQKLMGEAAEMIHQLASRNAGVTAAPAPVVPQGWKLVPIEPTTEMCLADWNVGMSDAHSDTGVSACVWAAMLAAAPAYQPEDEDGVRGGEHG